MLALGPLTRLAGLDRNPFGLRPPYGYVFLVDPDGSYLTDPDGMYLLEPV